MIGAGDGKRSLGLECWTGCLGWSLWMTFCSANCGYPRTLSLTAVLAAQRWGSSWTAKLLSSVAPLRFGRLGMCQVSQPFGDLFKHLVVFLCFSRIGLAHVASCGDLVTLIFVGRTPYQLQELPPPQHPPLLSAEPQLQGHFPVPPQRDLFLWSPLRTPQSCCSSLPINLMFWYSRQKLELISQTTVIAGHVTKLNKRLFLELVAYRLTY